MSQSKLKRLFSYPVKPVRFVGFEIPIKHRETYDIGLVFGVILNIATIICGLIALLLVLGVIQDQDPHAAVGVGQIALSVFLLSIVILIWEYAYTCEIDIDQESVRFFKKTLFKKTEFKEPLANYQGVCRAKHMDTFFNVVLKHREDATKDIELCRLDNIYFEHALESKQKYSNQLSFKAANKALARYAETLKMPVLKKEVDAPYAELASDPFSEPPPEGPIDISKIHQGWYYRLKRSRHWLSFYLRMLVTGLVGAGMIKLVFILKHYTDFIVFGLNLRKAAMWVLLIGGGILFFVACFYAIILLPLYLLSIIYDEEFLFTDNKIEFNVKWFGMKFHRNQLDLAGVTEISFDQSAKKKRPIWLQVATAERFIQIPVPNDEGDKKWLYQNLKKLIANTQA